MAHSFQQNGQWQEAMTLYQQVLGIDPHHANSLHMLGVIAAQQGNHQQAVDLIEQAAKLAPGNAALYNNLGSAHQGLKQHAAALACFDQAISIDPNLPEAHCNRAAALKNLKQFTAALNSINQAISLATNYAEAYNVRGTILEALQQLPEALTDFEHAISLNPQHAKAHWNKAKIECVLKNFSAALSSCEQAIAIDPAFAEAYSSRGVILHTLNQPEAAITSCRKAILLKPDDALLHYNLGVIEQAYSHWQAAIESYDRATAIDPDHVGATWNKALIFLVTGDWGTGWPLHEWRWKRQDIIVKSRNFSQPLWLGGSSLEGKTILLHREQGLGDALQFCRYAPLVKKLGARVILEVPRSLMALLSTLEGVDEIVEQWKPLPHFDVHCPLMSLPLAFKTTPQNVPFSAGYLHSDPARVAQWKNRLGSTQRRRIGIAWSGNPNQLDDAIRSLELAQLLPYLPDNANYFVLQKDIRDIDRPSLLAHPDIQHFDDELADFSDTAALCQLMDLVISVCTSIAHLAGALGKPTWILLHTPPEWRWLTERSDSVWYDSARLYRQKEIGNWQAPLAQLRADLLQLK
jgi:tetratricopeptide (TPR) repeat protein